ncbi:MAG TPA: hypothetical protein VKU40_05565 [Thermoanaerobaculia bacterium]|nr:hypothetical protein [Thermoanaerobaculia bacterium]
MSISRNRATLVGAWCALSFLATCLPAPAQVANYHQKVEALPAPVAEVLYVRPVTLARGHLFTWAPEPRVVETATLVVVRVDPDLMRPTNAPEPILYAGSRTVEKLNTGHPSGHVIALVPGEFDPAVEPLWVGRPGLPARATPEAIESERAAGGERLRTLATARQAEVARPPLEAPDMASLLRGEIAELVLRFAPEEDHLVRKWRLPEVGEGYEVPR